MSERRWGCGRIALWSIVSILAMYGAATFWWKYDYYRSWETPERVTERLQFYVPGFRCEEMTVDKVAWSGFEDRLGSYLSMPDKCREDLRLRAQRSDRLDLDEFWTDSSRNWRGKCYDRNSRFELIELCFKDQEVYFGSSRVG